MQKPVPSQYKIFIMSPRRLRNTNRWPEVGSCRSTASVSAIRPGKPFRMSVASLARYILVWSEGAITSLRPRCTRRRVDLRQDATQRGRVEDRRNTNHVPTRMNHLDRAPDGKRETHGQETRDAPLVTATANRPTSSATNRSALPRLRDRKSHCSPCIFRPLVLVAPNPKCVVK